VQARRPILSGLKVLHKHDIVNHDKQKEVTRRLTEVFLIVIENLRTLLKMVFKHVDACWYQDQLNDVCPRRIF
jgi:hypothetical protein